MTVIKPTKPEKKEKGVKLLCQDWRAAKETLSKSKTYENAVELQRAARILKNTVRLSLVVHENHK